MERSLQSAPAVLAEELRAVLAGADRRIECAWLFGSAARGEAGPLSDVDVAVLIAETATPMARLEVAAALVEALERRVSRADVVILNEAPPALRHRVIRDGILLLERDARRRVDFEVRSIREYLDFQHFVDIYDSHERSRAGLALDREVLAVRRRRPDESSTPASGAGGRSS